MKEHTQAQYIKFLDNLTAIAEQATHLSAEECSAYFSDRPVNIEFNGMNLSVPFDADIYEALRNLIQDAITNASLTTKSIIVGRTYHTDTWMNVTPVKVLSNNRALFVTDETSPTPYVIWYYDLPDDYNKDLISLYAGHYYSDLNRALAAAEI